MLSLCIDGGSIEDAGVRASLASLSIKDGVSIDTVYLTLLAVHILSQSFRESAAESAQIIVKAKTYLESVGVRRPNSILSKFSLRLLGTSMEIEDQDQQEQEQELMKLMMM